MIKKISVAMLVVILGLVAFGPGWVYWRSPHVRPVEISEDFLSYVHNKEASFTGVKQDNSSFFAFNAPQTQSTDVALVYLHGFSASPREISPVMESVGAMTKSHVYFPRLAGHGLQDGQMFDLTSDELFQDAEESYQVAKRLGKKIVLVGTSTGGTLALWLASRHSDIAGLVLISPNLGIRDPRGFLAGGPLGYWIARAVVGPYHQWKPRNPEQEKFWTTKYSVNGVRAMTDVVREVERLDFSKIQIPTLMLWTEKDRVVNIERAKELLSQMSSSTKEFVEIKSNNHVLAGNITSPETTNDVVDVVSKFVLDLK
ncbi:alpha/beta hydrolase [Pseudobdellovibrio exovorus]|uniref:Serine aminopeptidase S33 domain-containing protein n=1 Tax=Pseudobdellovibrio exovorus JSS TaxID=1184267 RepID=M4V7Y3_9BACT|nr:alpha/beta fold hydrolase [Pseudobdellovibrio exovorus]AGH94540.1 hypothetical protein A11Q_320 [Pseudobdellovibrio exovorus JSS]